MRRPILLLPPSKGKADGGSGPPLASSPAGGHELATARAEVLDAAVAAATELDDADAARVFGVRRSHVAPARAAMAELATAPTMPANRRYTGIVHGNARLGELDVDAAGVDVRIVSALRGLVALDEPVPDYRLEFAATLPPLGGLATFWRDHLDGYLDRLVDGRRVWDLLPGEHARMWPKGLRERSDVVDVAFVRPDGRAANAARTKVAKGRLAAWLIATPDAEVGDVVERAELGEGWSLDGDRSTITATWTA